MVFDILAGYLRHRGGEVRLRNLVSLMRCFDIPETTVRVVAMRLRNDGWLSSLREGRETVYTVTDAGWKLLDEGSDRIFNRPFGPWDGQWHMVIYSVPEMERTLRDQLRKKLSWLGFGPLSAAIWLSPHDRREQVLTAFADQPSVQMDVFRARSMGLEADRSIVSRAWDLEALDRAYVEYLEVYRPRLVAYRAGELGGADALVERMKLIDDYRGFPFSDPDLPPELLPVGWHGRRAHEVFLEAHGLLRPAAEAYVGSVLDVAVAAEQEAG
ncbi:phenylacetic acid degradation operon negative regulatory protein [Pseudonocardia eucalypti]|uniref:PaaX family transcriptional regulator n=1 Tax=Pseudonocardia eucalypti TaxID=648755 RepID=UPI0018187E8A|nr:phenylacetic acid degradation operon negative regulatory protein [Pseudonocardia eucalypti]